MSETNRSTLPLPPGPRHMRRRRFRREIPDQLLPGGSTLAGPVPARQAPVGREREAETPAQRTTAVPAGASAKGASLRTKRLVALSVVLAVSAAVPTLIVALVLLS